MNTGTIVCECGEPFDKDSKEFTKHKRFCKDYKQMRIENREYNKALHDDIMRKHLKKR